MTMQEDLEVELDLMEPGTKESSPGPFLCVSRPQRHHGVLISVLLIER